MSSNLWTSSIVLILFSACTPTGGSGQDSIAADSDWRDEMHYELLGHAAKGNIEQIKAILDGRGKDLVDVRAKGTGETALFRAADFGQVEVTRFLLSRGSDANTANMNGETPLYAASFKGNALVVQTLLDGGANPNSAEFEYGFTPLIVSAWKGHADVVRLLIKRNVDINYAAKDGSTAILRATRAGHTEVVALLRAAGSHSVRK